MEILFYPIAIAAVETIVRPDPDKALFVFRHAGGGIAAEAAIRGDMIEWNHREGLRRCRYARHEH